MLNSGEGEGAVFWHMLEEPRTSQSARLNGQQAIHQSVLPKEGSWVPSLCEHVSPMASHCMTRSMTYFC